MEVFVVAFFDKKKLHVRHSWRGNNLYLKGVFECNLMEWKPQYLFEYTNSTVRLISDDCFIIFIHFFYCFAFPFAQSGHKDFTFTRCFIFGSETQAGCSSVVGFFCYFILFFIFYFVGLERRLCCRWPALCLLLQFFRRTRSRGGEELGVFVLFLVQYAVHKSLALEIIRLFSSSFFFLSLFNGYIAVFLSVFFFFWFFIKNLWTSMSLWLTLHLFTRLVYTNSPNQPITRRRQLGCVQGRLDESFKHGVSEQRSRQDTVLLSDWGWR